MKKYTLILCMMLFTLNAVQAWGQKEKETMVLIETDKGKIKVKLYNDTPLHRDNFIKLVEEGKYEGLLFHRVIKQFMIQGGDIHSKDAQAGQKLGEDDPGYTIPAEIRYPEYFHKAGMLCAARESDDVNPERASSPTQFYIVTGKFYTAMELDKMEQETHRKFSPEERQTYMLEGGAPHLDGKYTIFGEVVNGMKAVDKIQYVLTDENDRPLENIKIRKMRIVKK
ncbi:peptidylprolyl isomerase [Parabacteroides sp. Marseille-P3160]|uniref:peptidylprolyl isomerase n=1 Tax=Parabacteroides sp. Marseille-P3160 TaxID=1917887 RepID=UPI0009BB2915|nr:peptidylprolyl isomerase [Parabacteroides sp. Marseille-P3160]